MYYVVRNSKRQGRQAVVRLINKLEFKYLVILLGFLLVVAGKVTSQDNKEENSPAKEDLKIQPVQPSFSDPVVIPVASKEFDTVIDWQGKFVVAPGGSDYLVLGATESSKEGCLVLLMNYGEKVPCVELLSWQTGQGSSDKEKKDK